MIVLAVCNHKGGTGKTTTVMHVSAALGLSGYRTLVIDLDPQGFLTRAMGESDPSVEASSLALFDPDTSLSEVPCRTMANFDLIPASPKLTKQMRRLNKPTDVLWIREALACSLDYDAIVFDTAAAVTVYSLNALVASQHVLIPVLPEYQPVVGAEQTYQTASFVRQKLNPRLRSMSFLFTQVDARKRIHQTYRQYIRRKYEGHVLNTQVRTSTSLAKTYHNGETVFDHNPQARGARDYANATDELLRRIEKATPKPASGDAPSVRLVK
jgi:chromosome partitioning protein